MREPGSEMGKGAVSLPEVPLMSLLHRHVRPSSRRRTDHCLSQYIIIILSKTGRAYEVENCISFVLNLPKSRSSGRHFYFTYLLMGSVSYCPKMFNIQKASDSLSGLNSSQQTEIET